MGFKGINHLVLVTNDMDKTVRFYRDALGMQVVGTMGAKGDGQSFRH
ncbi:MAG: VOC family protein, partial [Chloroflexi bacterium]|nr:VOC family protein [Chloroflexota bacterium]